MLKDIEKFIDYLENELNYSHNTCISYQKDIESFYNYIFSQGFDISDVDVNLIRNYSTSIAPNGHSNPSSPSTSATAFACPSSSNSNTSGRVPTQRPHEPQSSGFTLTFAMIFPSLR